MTATPDILVCADIRFPLERANGVQIVKTSAALAAAGARIELVVRRSDERSTEEILALYGIEASTALRVRRLDVGHRRGVHVVPRAAFLWQAVFLARSHARRGGALLTRDLQLADFTLRARGRKRGPIAYEAHAVEALMYQERAALYGSSAVADPRKTVRLKRREGRVWRAADAFVCTTAGIRDSFVEEHGARDHVAVIPNGCDVPLDRSWTPPPGPPRVLYAGQLYPWKGVDLLVEAMVRVPAATLVVVGGLPGESDLARIRALVERHGLTDRTEMKATIPQAAVADELRRASVVVVPYRRTAMTERHTSPLKAFEAMAAGRPIVATDLPSSREFLEDGATALLVPPDDAAALGDAIGRLVDDQALAQRLARAAFDRAPQYSWESRARRLVALLESAA